MLSSAELEDLLIKHSDQIDEEHIHLFLKLINELRVYNNVNTPFKCINNNIHTYYCENYYSFNICRCQSFYEKYLLALKLFNLYKRIFNC